MQISTNEMEQTSSSFQNGPVLKMDVINNLPFSGRIAVQGRMSGLCKTECIHVCNSYQKSFRRVNYMCVWIPHKSKQTRCGRVCEDVALTRPAVWSASQREDQAPEVSLREASL